MDEERLNEILEEQKKANRFLRSAKRMLGTDMSSSYTERAYWKARQRMRMFQVKHGQHKGYQFSMKGLDDDELDLYEEMLKSVTENVRLNPALEQKHKESQIQFYQDQGWAKDERSAEAMYDFKGSEIFEELMENNLSDIPSELLERYGKFVDSNYTIDDFSNMITVFNKQLTLGNNQYRDVNDFYKFTDKYFKRLKKSQEDFNKGISEFLEDESGEFDSFFDYMDEYYGIVD